MQINWTGSPRKKERIFIRNEAKVCRNEKEHKSAAGHLGKCAQKQQVDQDIVRRQGERQGKLGIQAFKI